MFTTSINTFNDILESIRENGSVYARYSIGGHWSTDPIWFNASFRYGGKINYDIGCSSGGNNGDDIAYEMKCKSAALAHAAELVELCQSNEDALFEAYETYKKSVLAVS